MHQLEDMYLCENCFANLNASDTVCPVCGFQKENYTPEAGVLPVGEILAGKYLIGRMLGRGGFGITYLGYDIPSKRKIAIKEYLPDGLAARQPGQTTLTVYTGEKEDLFKKGADRFFEEAKMVSRFNGNPNIVSVYEFFYENNTAYFVMEYLDGVDMKKYVAQKGGRLELNEALRLILPVMDALTIVHSAGVLHRDISPDNIFVTRDGGVKLLDFGAARQVIGEQSKSLSVVLKQGFAPIEQYQTHGHFGPWSDIYALCATFYYMITGKVPEAAMDRMDLDQLMPPSAMGIALPLSLEQILMRGLSYRPADRPQSVIELKAEFQRAVPPSQADDHETPVYINPYSQQSQGNISPSQMGGQKPYPASAVSGGSTGYHTGGGQSYTPQQPYAQAPAAGISPDLAAFVNTHADYYSREFEKLDNGQRAGFHIPAFFLTFYWMFYRKMYMEAGILFGAQMIIQLILAFLLSAIVNYSDVLTAYSIITSLISIAVLVICGLFGNRLYYRYYRRALAEAGRFDNREAWLRSRGGTLSPGILAAVIIGLLIVSGIASALGSSRIFQAASSGYSSGYNSYSSGGGSNSGGNTTDDTQKPDNSDKNQSSPVDTVKNMEYKGKSGLNLGSMFDLYFTDSNWKSDEASGTDTTEQAAREALGDNPVYKVTYTGNGYFSNRLSAFVFEFSADGSDISCTGASIDNTSIKDEDRDTLFGYIDLVCQKMKDKDAQGLSSLLRINQDNDNNSTLKEADYYFGKAGINYDTKIAKSKERVDITADSGKVTLTFFEAIASNSNLPAKSYILVVKNDEVDVNAFLSYYWGTPSLPTNEFFPGTDRQPLDRSALKRQSQTRLWIMRNEIFARKSRKFDDPLLSALFATKSWYRPLYSQDEFHPTWNAWEEDNVNLIVDVEKELGYR